MAQQNESGVKSFNISEDVAAYRAVTFGTTAGEVGYTAAGGRIDGYTQRDADDSDGDAVAVRLVGAPGTFKATAAGTVTVGIPLYAAASGKLSATAVGPVQAIALTAGGADEVIEVAAVPAVTQGSARVVEAHTATDTLTAAESGSVHTTTGASGTVVLNLPAATVGLEFFFRVGAAQALQIEPATGETISLPSTGVPETANDYISADAIGETVHLMCCTAGSWSVMGYTGTWTGQ